MKAKPILSALACLALSACLVTACAPGSAYAAGGADARALTAGAITTQGAAKEASTITLKPQTKTYTGKKLAYTGKVTRSGSTGKVTYRYYKDRKCTKAAAPKAAGTYYVRATLAGDAGHKAATSNVVKLTVKKAGNPMAVRSTAQGISLKALQAKARTVTVLTVTKAQGEKSFKVTDWTTKAAKKYFTVDAKTGKVTARKGTPAGTYRFKVRVTAKGNKNYKAGSRTRTVKVTVKNKTWVPEQGHYEDVYETVHVPAVTHEEPVYTTVVDQEEYTTYTRVYHCKGGFTTTDSAAAADYQDQHGGNVWWDDIEEYHPAVTHQEQTGTTTVVDEPAHDEQHKVGTKWVVDVEGHWE